MTHCSNGYCQTAPKVRYDMIFKWVLSDSPQVSYDFMFKWVLPDCPKVRYDMIFKWVLLDWPQVRYDLMFKWVLPDCPKVRYDMILKWVLPDWPQSKMYIHPQMDTMLFCLQIKRIGYTVAIAIMKKKNQNIITRLSFSSLTSSLSALPSAFMIINISVIANIAIIIFIVIAYE